MATTTANAVETKLYVTNFPSSATRQQLQQFFSRFGRVQECAIMWNSYAFVHYATMEEARRALDQSNGAMFLNRKLIVQLSTSRFRPQPKESNSSQSPKQLMILPYQQQQPPPSSQSTQYFEMMTQTEPTNYFRSSSPLQQDMNNYYSNLSSSIKLNNNLKTDVALNGQIPKLYCTNLPDNCKAHDLQRIFSTFGQVIDCVILWDYYAFITYKTFHEAERALIALNGFTWKDRNLIVEWSRASGRKQQQQQQSSPTHHSDMSNQSSPRTRPTSLLKHSNNQFYSNNSPTFNPMMPMLPQQQQQAFLAQHQRLTNDNSVMFDSLTQSSSNHHLDLSPFIDTNSSSLFSSSSELNTPSSATSNSYVYQPSDIAALLEPSTTNKSMNDITNLLSSTNQVPPSCSSAAAAENLLSSLFNSFEPFNKFYSADEQTSSRYNHLSPLLTTAPDKNLFPISYGHNNSWH